MNFLISGLTIGCAISVFYNVDIKEVYSMLAIGKGNMVLDLSLGIPLFIASIALAYFLYSRTSLRKGK